MLIANLTRAGSQIVLIAIKDTNHKAFEAHSDKKAKSVTATNKGGFFITLYLF